MPEPGSGILRAPPSPPPTFAGSGSTLQRDPRSRCRWPIEFLYPTGCRDLPTPHAPPVSAPALTLLASTNSSSAWTAAASLSGSPESIRDSSATRSEPSSKAALARPSAFSTRMCRSAKEAICGRWVTTSTCRLAAKAANRFPTATAALPPIPASFIEDQRWHVVEIHHDAAAGEHGPRELAARGHLGERERGLPRPAGEQQLDPLGPGRAGLVQGPALNLHHDPLHAQLAQFRLDHRSKPRPGLGPDPGEPAGGIHRPRREVLDRRPQPDPFIIRGRQRGESGPRLLQVGQDPLFPLAVLPLEGLERRNPFPDLLKAGRIEDDGHPVAPQVSGQVTGLLRQGRGPIRQSLRLRVQGRRLPARGGHPEEGVDSRPLGRQDVFGQGGIPEEPLRRRPGAPPRPRAAGVVLDLGVRFESADSAAAFAQNAKDMQAVLDALKAAGITDKDVQTTNVSLEQNTQNQGKPNERRVFVASNSVQVTIHDLSSVGSVIDAAVNAGADSVNDISFQLSNPNTIRTDALSQAVTGARTKAEALARAAGAEVVRVVTIDEQNFRPPVYNQSLAALPGAGVPTPVVPPSSLQVSVTIAVVWEIA